MPEDDDRIKLAFPDGTEHEFDPNRHLTRSALSHVKGWYPSPAFINPDTGSAGNLWEYWPFQRGLGIGDPDAVAIAMWCIRRLEGISPNQEPKQFAMKVGDPSDFAVGKVCIAPNRREGVDPPRWQLNLDEGEYTLDMDEDLTCAMLRQIKRWYPHCGTFASFYLQLLKGDPDCVACAIWVVRTVAGVQPNPNPRDLEDFSIGVVSAAPNVPDEFVEQEFTKQQPLDPTETGTDQPAGTPTTTSTDSSTETPTNSGSDG